MSESPFGFIAERRIRDAMARGEFDGLRTAGKPLDLSDAGDPDWWIKRRLREDGDLSAVVPPVFQLRKQRAEILDSLGELPSQDAVREVVESFNAAVHGERRRPSNIPVGAIAMPIDPDAALRRWRAGRPASS